MKKGITGSHTCLTNIANHMEDDSLELQPLQAMRLISLSLKIIALSRLVKTPRWK